MKTITAKTFTNSLLLAVLLTACGGGPKPTENGPAQEINLLSQQEVNAVLWYNTSAENAYIYEQTYKMAAAMTMQNMKEGKPKRPNAVVLDIDETVLDNSPYMVNLIKTGQTYTEESWAAWVMKMRAEALPGVVNYLRFCEENNIEVFYISNRSINYLEYTIQNMMNLNLPFADESHIFLKQDESDKTSRREPIESQFNVLLYIGDNLLDFDKIYADRGTNYGKGVVADTKDEMLTRHLLLPNPMYGQWQKAFYNSADLSPNQNAKNKLDLIIIEDH